MDDLTGKIKEAAGKLIGNEDLEAEGRTQRTGSGEDRPGSATGYGDRAEHGGPMADYPGRTDRPHGGESPRADELPDELPMEGAERPAGARGGPDSELTEPEEPLV